MAAYQISQMWSYHLGKRADTHGRKLCVMRSPTQSLGLTRNFGVACAIRFAMGLPNAIVGVSKAMGPELFPAHQQVLAMSMISGMWGLGNIVGPSLGGLLSETGPADSLRTTFRLPNAICAAFAAVSSERACGRSPASRTTSTPTSSAPRARAAARVCLPRNAIPPLVGYFGLAFSAIMFDEIFPLFCVAPAACRRRRDVLRRRRAHRRRRRARDLHVRAAAEDREAHDDFALFHRRAERGSSPSPRSAPRSGRYSCSPSSSSRSAPRPRSSS